MVKKKTAKKAVKKDIKKELDKQKKEAIAKLNAAKKKFVQLEKKVKQFVKKNPGKAALIASATLTALGTSIAVLLKKKQKKK